MNIKNRNTLITTLAITVLLLVLVGATYAFFAPQGGGLLSRNISATSNTTDHLSFQLGNDISFRVTQTDFAENAGNKDGYTTATAMLTPNNYTGAATMYYYMYLNLNKNEIVYSAANTNKLPELMLQVFDSSNQLVTLYGLGNQVTVGSLTGYDITEKEGLITLLNNHPINASNNQSTTETWRIVVTLINHNFNQNDNTGKEVMGLLIINKNSMLTCEEDPTGPLCSLAVSNNLEEPEDVQLQNGYLYYHDGSNKGTLTKYQSIADNYSNDYSHYNQALDSLYTNYVTNSYFDIILNGPSIDENDYYDYENDYWDEESFSEDFLQALLTLGYIQETNDGYTTIVDNFDEEYSDFWDIYDVLYDEGYITYDECQTVIGGNTYCSSDYYDDNLGETDYDAMYEDFYSEINEADYIRSSSENFTIDADDGSYRYAGANPNNYICFGADTCSGTVNRDNLYRIIGVIPVDVVVDDSNPNNIITERQMLYKIIKNDYETSSSLGINGISNQYIKTSSYDGPAGNFPEGDVLSFSMGEYNTWSLSELNTIGLNTNALNSFNSTWQKRIAKVMWKVGGNNGEYLAYSMPSVIYRYEITYSGINTDNNEYWVNPEDNKTEYAAKIGLMYVSDYAYATPKSNWTSTSTSNARSNNWLYKGVYDWTISRSASGNSTWLNVSNNGSISFGGNGGADGTRRVFYLTKNTSINMDDHTGTISDPFTIDCKNCHTITFNSNGGSSVDSQKVEHNDTASAPIQPTRTNYGFVEWQLNGVTYDFTTPITSDITLDALWEITGYTSGDGVLYNHNQYLENGIGDNSFRYAGANPNNYICFGADTCSGTVNRDNLYRIIGIEPVDVVTDDSNPNNIITSTEYLYKIIKNDFETSTNLGITSPGNASKIDAYAGPSGNQPTGDVQGFYWRTDSNQYNTWNLSGLNITGLNTNAYGEFNSTWKNRIAKVKWKTGGNTWNNIITAVPMSVVYRNEITYSGVNINNESTWYDAENSATEYVGKIGLMYVSDYGYAAPQSAWTKSFNETNGYGTSTILSNNWLYKGVDEWSITRYAQDRIRVYEIMSNGKIGGQYSSTATAVRRVYYLKSSASVDTSNHAGTISDPFTIGCTNCHTVTFNLNGGTGEASQLVEHNELALQPTNPVKTYYSFTGWTLNGTPYDFSTPVTSDITLTANYIQTSYPSGTGELYYHSQNLENGANDGSYRYAGANPNNYICFGADTCSGTVNRDSLYRIIGIEPVDVVTDDSNPNNVITSTEYLYKIIKNDFETSTNLGITSPGNASKIDAYAGPSGNQPSGDVQGFTWRTNTNQYNTWNLSGLNITGLNTNAYGEFNSTWKNRIAKVKWKTGGNTWNNIITAVPMSVVYRNEITYSGVNINNESTWYDAENSATEYVGKIGLMYVSDYGYAAPQSAWTKSFNDTNGSVVANNWLYKGVDEWSITRYAQDRIRVYEIMSNGKIGGQYSSTATAVRRVFYIKSYVNIDKVNHSGTISDPFTIGCTNCHTVTFNLNGGTGDASQLVEHNESAIEPTTPTRTNYTFTGWTLNGNPYDFSTPVTGNITLTANWFSVGDGYYYHHDSSLANSANDGSYRYAGANPNNYVCFGSDAATCPADNIYRIIGRIPVNVITDETDPNNPVIASQLLYKLIKNDYENDTTLGITSLGNATKVNQYNGPSGNQPSGTVKGYPWMGYVGNDNTWSMSTLNTTGLNTTAYGTFSSTWQNKIAKVIWKVGGNMWANIGAASSFNAAYRNEIINSGININNDNNFTPPDDNKNEYAAKIGLMYISDYIYATPSNVWSTQPMSINYYYPTALANNWLYKGVFEWTITRVANATSNAYYVQNNDGDINTIDADMKYGVRRVFYLTSNTTLDTTNHAGSLADPYRVN